MDINAKLYDEEDDNFDAQQDAASEADEPKELGAAEKPAEESGEPPAEDAAPAEPFRPAKCSEYFLKSECAIENEACKTELRFAYRGDEYRGIVLKKLPYGSGDYVFLVRKAGRSVRRGQPNPKTMKKIHVADVSVL